MSNFEKGSEWRKWDLHIHTPASYHWKGKHFDLDNPDSKENIALVDEMIEALNNAEPAVFALMDYWTFDGWFALKKRLQNPEAPKLKKRVFPGIELRLVAPTDCRLNAHVLFSNEIEDQVLRDFKSQLNIEIIKRPLSDDALISLAREVGEDKLKKHGFKKAEIDADKDKALLAGSTIAEINCDSYKAAIEKVPNGQAIGFMPYDTSDGLNEVKWQEHYAYFLGLFKTSPIFETRSSSLRALFVGEKNNENKKFFDNFQKGLGNIPRLAVSGSDAHRFVGIKNDNDNRGYGDFPSGKATWIKADPTFLGLLQAIKEPAKRSYIGEKPDKLIEIESNKSSFIDNIKVAKHADSKLPEDWLDGVNIPLNPDLIAIIGNKGSGKSALADVIALLGNSRQTERFSFLNDKRFRGKSSNGAAKHFTAEITWNNKDTTSQILSENPKEEQLIRYIPQNYFEELCNEHISGQSSLFQKELQTVIFDHSTQEIRLGALDFEQLIEKQENGFRSQLIEYRKELAELNKAIETLENQGRPQTKQSFHELLNRKIRDIEAHQLTKPDELQKPSEQLSPEQKEAASTLEKIAVQLKTIEQQEQENKNKRVLISKKRNAAKSIKDRISILERQYQQFQIETSNDFQTLELSQASFVSLTINFPDEKILLECTEQEILINATDAKIKSEKESFVKQQTELKQKLNQPQLQYQQYLKDFAQWEIKLQELTGDEITPDTEKGLKAKISQLDKIPNQLEEKYKNRIKLAEDIFDTLDKQRQAREVLYKPVQDAIENNQLIKDEYPLQFQANLVASIDKLSSDLFSLIQRKGDFRGEDENKPTINVLADEFDINTKEGALNFIKALHSKIRDASSNSNQEIVGIHEILRKDKSKTPVKPANAVYDLIYGLDYLEPRYSLSFQNTQIEQLSPGQRGALLLIFYLLIDKGHNPIILDQPEENLDNETVVDLLVPVLTEAKKKRQIIMVTHNPNLAVVCDAEQVIYATFDRKNDCKISYVSGSIENGIINEHVVNVLEGKKPAFNNRKIKYL